MPGVVERERQRPADHRINGHPIDHPRPERLALDLAVGRRQCSKRRADQQVVIDEHVLDRIQAGGAERLVGADVPHRRGRAPVHPLQVRVGQLVAVGAQEVVAERLEPVKPLEVQRRDQPAPQIGELVLRCRPGDVDFLDDRSGLLQRGDRLPADARHLSVDGKAAERRRPGDARAGGGPSERAERVVVKRKAQWIARRGPRDQRQPQGRIGDRPSDDALVAERGQHRERVGAIEGGDPAR